MKMLIINKFFKGFSTSSSLNTHRRIHSGEKPHECGVCGKRFTASSNLYYHRMTHVKVLHCLHGCSIRKMQNWGGQKDGPRLRELAPVARRRSQHVGSLNLGHGFFNLPLHPTESLSMSIPTERLEEKRQRGRARRSNQSVAVRQPVIFVIAIPHFRSELDKARRD